MSQANGRFGSNLPVPRRGREGLESAPSCQCSRRGEAASVARSRHLSRGKTWSSTVSRQRSKLDVPICGSPVVPRTTGVGTTSGTLC